MNNRNVAPALLAAGAVVLVAAGAFLAFSERVPTGYIGLRQNWDRSIASVELQPGSLNQTFIGDVLLFQTRDVLVERSKILAQDAEGSQLGQLTVIGSYSIAPDKVSELYSTKSKAFNGVEDDGDILLMHRYVSRVIDSAAQAAVRKHTSEVLLSAKATIERDILKHISDQLLADGLGTSIIFNTIQVTELAPNSEILQKATELVKQRKSKQIKEAEVETAALEAQRMAALAANSRASIDYMDAQSRQTIAQAVREGKVKTIIVPTDFKGQIRIND